MLADVSLVALMKHLLLPVALMMLPRVIPSLLSPTSWLVLRHKTESQNSTYSFFSSSMIGPMRKGKSPVASSLRKLVMVFLFLP